MKKFPFRYSLVQHDGKKNCFGMHLVSVLFPIFSSHFHLSNPSTFYLPSNNPHNIPCAAGHWDDYLLFGVELCHRDNESWMSPISMQQIHLWLEMSWYFPILCSAQPVKGHFNTVDVYISFVAKKVPFQVEMRKRYNLLWLWYYQCPALPDSMSLKLLIWRIRDQFP